MEYKYLNFKALDALDEKAFLNKEPFPYSNPKDTLTDEGFKALVKTAPDVSQFEASFGETRPDGAMPHDRYQLFYEEGETQLSPEWQDFIAELQSERYQQFVTRMFGEEKFIIRFQWHYAITGCSVSPHTDSPKKMGTQLFYLNTHEDWKEEWGGSTLVLNDTDKKFVYTSAPDYDDFDSEEASTMLENYSFIFARTDHSWHAVRPLTSPEGKMRKMFAVVFDHVPQKPSILKRVVSKIKN